MKNKHLVLAIVTMAVAAILSIAVVSCKKDTTSEMVSGTSESPAAFDPSHITDMNAYLKDFKQRMKTSKDGETLTLEEAAWHLSSLANYDFGHANVEYDDIRFDTLYGTVTVTDGTIMLSDLAAAYEQISTDIDLFYHTLSLENKHFRFIGCQISEQGSIAVPIITTFSSMEKWHFFADSSFCDIYLDDNTIYYANTVAVQTLTNLFNLIIGKNTDPNSGRIYYVVTGIVLYKWNEWYEDPNNYCPNAEHSRLYCSCYEYSWPIPKADMCYYVDSYIGLGVENVNSSSGEVVSGFVTFHTAGDGATSGTTLPQLGNHSLTVQYGVAVASPGNDY